MEALAQVSASAPTGSASLLLRLEADLLARPQVETPLVHHFAPGVYCREITMPAGSIILGHEHTTEHLNVVLSGSALVSIGGKVERIAAPAVFSSRAGVRKALLIETEMRWMTIHPTAETDLEKLETALVKKSAVWHEFAPDLAALSDAKKEDAA